ncbi:MAG: DUF1573 domain-containing protein [Bacteroidetes bacterium]|nr:DUF1573 domain-containing protein [Bacteroidota bacterium]
MKKIFYALFISLFFSFSGFFSFLISSSSAQTISGGYYHSAAQCSACSEAWTWGYNGDGELGNGTFTNRNLSGAVSGLSGVTSVAAGWNHNLALKNNGTVWAWGYNGYGQLGDGTYNTRTVPVQVSGLTGIIAIAAGGYHSLALKNDGTVWAWGYNGYGQLGDSTFTGRNVPVQVHNISGVISIGAGGYHSLAVKNNGTAWAWGYNGNGQLGDGTTTQRIIPVQVSGLSGAKTIAGGLYHTVILKTDSTGWAFGYNGYGQLGDNTYSDRTTAVQIHGIGNVGFLTGIKVLQAGGYNSIAAKVNGIACAWGYNGYGQLGNNSFSGSAVPVQMNGLTNISFVAAGLYHTLAMDNSGSIWACGYNGYGQLGDGTYTSRNVAVRVTQMCPTQTLNLDISLPNSCPKYDTLITGANENDTILLSNNGCDSVIISSVVSSDGQFSVVSYPSSIQAINSGKLIVKFSPTTSGNHTTSITVYNNAADTTFCLQGYSIPAPVLSYKPTSLSATLACCDSTTDTLKIFNTGGSTLNYNLSGYSSTILYSQSFTQGQTPTTQATAWVTFRQQLTSHPYNKLRIYGSNNPTGITLTDATAIANIANAMNTLTNYSTTVAGNTWNVYVNACNGGIQLAVNTVACNCDGASPNVYLLRPEIGNNNWGGINTATCNGPTQTMSVEFSYGIPWLQVTPASGNVSIGDSAIVSVKFKSCGYAAGTYSTNITINSNDPQNSSVNIPTTLTVIGAGKISLTKSCMYLDSIMQYTTHTDSLYVKNTGCDTLKVTNAFTQTSVFTVTPNSGNILPYDSAKVYVTFAPTTVGTFYDTITILNNDVTKRVCLSGKSFAAPIETHSPGSFNETLTCADTVYDTLAVSNTGASDLYFNLTSSSSGKSLSVNGSSQYANIGAWSPGTKWTIEAWVRPTSLPAGRHTIAGGMGGCLDWGIVLENGYFGVGIRPGGCSQTISSNVLAVVGTWYHIVGTNDGTTAKIYVNGVLKSSGSVDPNYSGYTGGTWIGGESCCGNYFSGLIDEVRIWNVTRTQSQITSTMGRRLFGNEAGLVAYYNFDNGTVTDLSSGGHNGTLNNGATTVTPNAPVAPAWLIFDSSTDTVAFNNTVKMPVEFISTGLIVGTYTSSITINSNDPVHSPDVVPVTMTVTGAGKITLSKNCMYLDSIMVYTTHKDSLYIKNTGCDTLKVTNAFTQTSFFTVTPNSGNILPGDSVKAIVTFAPTTVGTYYDTLTILNSDVTKKVCLSGKGFPRPIISVSPSPLYDTLACVDSATVILTINNSGGNNLIYNINIQGNALPIAASCTPTTTGYCCGMGIYNVTLNTINNSTGNGIDGYKDYTSTQNTILVPGKIYTLSVQTGTSYNEYVEAWIDYNNDGVFQSGEQIMNNLNSLPNAIHTGTFIVPTSAVKNKAVRMRIASDYQFSSIPTSCSNEQYGQAEDYTIKLLGWLAVAPNTGTVTPSSSNTVAVTFNSSGLSVGTYTANISISNNDPLNNPVVVPVSLTVIGAGKISLTKTCLYLDSIMEFTSHTDSLYIKNTGCDTLTVSNITKQTSVFTVSATSFKIATGDSAKLKITFSPVTSPGPFYDTLTILNSDVTKKVCLSGKSFARPIETHSPSAFNVTLSCCDSITLPLTVHNTGGSNLIEQVTGNQNFVEGFENGLSKWVTGGSPNTWAIVADPHSGTYSLKESPIGNYSNSMNQYIQLAKKLTVSDKTTCSLNFWEKGQTECSFDYYSVQLSVNGGPFNTLTTLNCSFHSWTQHTISLTPFVNNGDSINVRFLFTSDGSVVYSGIDMDDISVTGTQAKWITFPIITDTIAPNDSAITNITFNSCGLTIGTYSTTIIISSNDPLKGKDTVPVTLNVTGKGKITLSKNCLYLDSIMEYTTNTDTFYVKNTGCDTLKVTNITNNNSVFTVAPKIFNLLPGDSTQLVVTFSPVTSPVTFYDTLTILNNDTIRKVCLLGKSFARPIECHFPNSYNVHFSICQDTIIDSLHICNTGGSPLSWNLTATGGKSLSVNGSSQYVNTGAWSPGSKWTLEAWVMPSGTPGGRHTIVGGMGACYDWGIVQDNGVLGMEIRQPSGCTQTISSGVSVVLGTWYHIVGTDDGTTARVYVNGVLKASGTVEPNYVGYSGGTWIGGESCCGDYFPGLIDEVRIWNYARAQSQITSTLYSPLKGNETGLVAYYNFDNGTANDLSSGGHNGTFVNGASAVKPNSPVPSSIPGWVTFVPVSDTTPAMDTLVSTLIFVKSGTNPGTYNYHIYINSNDPLKKLDSVAVTLTIDSVAPVAPVSKDTAVCFGTSPNPPLIATGNAGDTIKWYDNPPLTNLVHVGNSFVSTQTAVGTYTYYVTATDSVYGCPSLPKTVKLTINAPPGTPTAGSNSPACTGQNLSLTASTITGATYNWNGPNSFTSSVQNPVLTPVTTAMAGTYSVTATVSGCPASSAGTTTVVVNQTPSSPAAGSNSPICAGNNLSLTASTVGSSTYNWNGPNSFTSTNQNPVIVAATIAASGNYSVTATDNGCTSPAGTTSVTVNAIPSAPAAGYNNPACTGMTLSLTASTITGATYNWNGPNGFTSSLQNPTITSATTAQSGTYSVTATVNGCTGAAGTVSVTVNVTPSAPSASSNSPVCSGTTLSLTASAGGSPTYNWNGPNSFVSGLQNPTISNITTLGSGTYSVTATENGCTGPAGTTSVIVNQTPAAPIAGSNSPICTGNNLSLTSSTMGSSTYNWNGPNGFSSTLQNPVIISASVTDAGTYSVTATDNGCTGPAGTVNVIVNPPPAAPTAGSNSPVCSGQNLSLTATSTGASYSWTGPNGFSSTSQNPVIVSVSTAANGTYSVIAINPGCAPSAAGTTSVTVYQTPSAPVASSNSPVCVGDNISLTASTSGSPTYNWNGPNGFTSASQNPVIASAGTINAGNYSVTATENGCTGPAGTTSVVVNNPPSVPTAGSNSPVCSGQTLSLTASNSGNSYNWNGPNGFSSTTQNPNIASVTTAASGNYSVTASVPGCPISAAGTTSITINQTPSAPTAGSNSPICAGTDLSLTASASGSPTYSWNGPSGFTSTSQNPVIVAAPTSASGTYSVTATAFGCTGPAGTVSVTVNPPPGTPTAGSNSPVCSGQTLSLTASTVSGATYNWNGPNGFTSTAQNPIIAGVTTAASGTYSVTVTVSGCPTSSAGTVSVTINQSPSAPAAGSNSPICAGTDLSLIASTSGSPTYSWNGPSGFTSASQNPVIVAATTAASGNYSVTATEFGCTGPAGTTSVTVNPIPAAPAVGNNSPVCTGDNLSLTAVAGVGAIYNWNGPNGFTSTAQNPVIVSAGTADAGTYSVTSTENGCTGAAGTTTVIVNTPPSVPTAGSNSPVCSGQTLSLTASNSGLAYNWNGPNGFTSTAQNPNIASVTTSASGTYSVVAINAGCPQSAAGTTSVTINQTPSAPAAGSNSPICDGSNLSLTANTSGSPTYSWSGPNGFTSSSQNPVIIAATTAATGTYSVAATEFGCAGPASTVSVTVNPIPSAPSAGSNSPVCEGQTLSLTASASGSPTYNWNGPNGFTSSLQNPTITNATSASSGTYSVTATASGCTGAAATVSVTINPLPAAPMSSPQSDSVCFGSPNSSFTAAGTNIEWWDDAATTLLEFSGSPFTPTVTASGTYTYYVTQTSSGCKGPSDTVLFKINFTPALAVNDTTVIFGGPPVVLSASGTNVQWYDASLTLVGSGNSYNTGQTAVGTYTYYVSQTMNGCESAKDTLLLTIVPGAPLGVNDTVCFGQPVPDLTATGTNLQWYDDAALTNLVFSGNPFPTGQTAVGTYTYYVTQTVNFVQSSSDTVYLIINPLPAAPTTSSQSACFGSVIPDLTATGTNIQWYDTSGAMVFTGTSFATGQTAAGTYTYYVTQIVNGCEGPADTATLIINALPSSPVAMNDTAICYGNPTPDLTASGTTIKWYDGFMTLVGTGSPFASGVTSPGTYTFIATQTNTVTTCESLGDTVLLTINAASAPSTSNVAVCFGALVPPLVAAGTNIQWYDTSMTLVFSGDTFNTGQTAAGTYTYYVTQTNTVTACSSVPVAVLLIISTQPTAAPVVSDTSACFGSAIPDLNATTGTIINWYSNAALTNFVFSGNPYPTGLTGVGTYTFFATDSTPGCPQGPSDTAMLTINSLPATPSVNDTSVCFGNSVPDLIFVGTNVQWYDTSMMVVFSGDTFSTGQTAVGTYTYYATQTNSMTGCASLKDSVLLTINVLPSAPAALDTTVCSASSIPNLTAIGTNVQWYDTSWTLVFTGNSFTTGQTSPGNYFYYVTQKDSVTGCESAADTSTLSIITSPAIPVANNVTACFGNPIPPLTSTGFNPMWYSNPSLTNLVNTGNTFNTGQTAVGVYTYWVKDSLSGCVSSGADSVSLIINPAPVKPTANDTALCYGNPAVLTSTGNNPQWFTDATLINMAGSGNSFNTGISAVGTYTFYVANYAAGCGNSVSDTAVLTINPNPPVTANTYSTSIVIGQSATLTAYNAVTYSWAPGGQTTQTIIVSPSVTTTYTVTGTNQYGCSGSKTIIVQVNPLGVPMINVPVENVLIYPNPAIDAFTLEFNTTLESPIDIYMINTLGDRVSALTNAKYTSSGTSGITKRKYEINTRNFTEGVYNLEIVTEKGTVNKRVILFR